MTTNHRPPALIASLAVVAIALIAYASAQPSLLPPAGLIEESGRDGARIESCTVFANTQGIAATDCLITDTIVRCSTTRFALNRCVVNACIAQPGGTDSIDASTVLVATNF